MWGSKFFRLTSGDTPQSHDHVGTVKPVGINWVTLAAAGVTRIPAGTSFMYNPDVAAGEDIESEVVPATGFAVGFVTQDITELGINIEAHHLKTEVLGLHVNEVKYGSEISLRRQKPRTEAEFEGVGPAGLGNLVATTGAGAILTGTARRTELSFSGGSWVLAAIGDWVMGILLDNNMPVESGLAGARRIRLEYTAPYKKSA